MEVLIGCLILTITTAITGLNAAAAQLEPEPDESESVRLELLKRKLFDRV